MSQDKDKRHDRIFEKLLEMWDSQSLISFFDAEYQRGLADGRAEILAKVEGLFRETPSKLLEPPKAPIAKSIEESKAIYIPDHKHAVTAAKPMDISAAVKPASKNVGGAPSRAGRPENIPTNLAMATEAIKDLGPSSAPQIREFIRKKYWEKMPDHWSAVLYEFVNAAHLGRDGINFTLPNPVPAIAAQTPRQTVTPGAKLGAPAQRTGTEFKYGDKTVMLHPREATLATMMRSAMGKGHLDAKFLANQIGIKSEAEMTIKEFMAIMNPKIAPLGLTISFYKGFGFSMAKVTA